MKQGRATHSGMGSTKVEPKPRAVNVTTVSRVGQQMGNHASDGGTFKFKSTPLYEGRGLEAPMKGTTQHHSGSQGRHK